MMFYVDIAVFKILFHGNGIVFSTGFHFIICLDFRNVWIASTLQTYRILCMF